jgi:hypothetical protein
MENWTGVPLMVEDPRSSTWSMAGTSASVPTTTNYKDRITSVFMADVPTDSRAPLLK